MTEQERYLLERIRLVTDRLSTPRINTRWTLHDVTMVRGLLRLAEQLRAYPQERSTDGAPPRSAA